MLWSSLVVDHWDWVWLQEQGKMDILHYLQQYFYFICRKKDPKCVVALDMMDWKLDVAKKCGADIVLNPSKCDLIEEINKLTDNLGCDVYIEATGAGSSVR